MSAAASPTPVSAAAPAHGGAGLAAAPQQSIAPQVATERAGEHRMVARPALLTLGAGGVAAFGYAAWAAEARRRRRLELARIERR